MERKTDPHDKPSEPSMAEIQVNDTLPEINAGRGVWRAASVALAALLLYSIDRNFGDSDTT